MCYFNKSSSFMVLSNHPLQSSVDFSDYMHCKPQFLKRPLPAGSETNLFMIQATSLLHE